MPTQAVKPVFLGPDQATPIDKNFAMDRMGRSKLYFNHISIRDWTRD